MPVIASNSLIFISAVPDERTYRVIANYQVKIIK